MLNSALTTIQNSLGLHARPAMAFVDAANGFECEVRVRRTDGDETVDGKSIMQMLLLAATQGTELEITWPLTSREIRSGTPASAVSTPSIRPLTRP